MKLKFNVEIGAASENKVIYDNSAFSFTSSLIALRNAILLVDYGLFLQIDCQSKDIVGLKGGLINYNIKKQKIVLENPVDGRISFIPRYKIVDSAVCPVLTDGEIYYDSENKLLLIGKYDSSGLTVRVCENLYLIIYENNIRGLIVAESMPKQSDKEE